MMDTKGKVTSKVVYYIKKNIQQGNWKLGEKIPSENELCRELNVSRVSVRSAIQQFVALDILESVHGKGSFVKNCDLNAFGAGSDRYSTSDCLDDIKAMLEFRCMIEPAICAKVVPDASQELIDKLTEYLQEMQDCKDDSERFVEMDIKFHMALSLETHNPVLINVMSDLLDKKKETYKIMNLTLGYYSGIYYHTLLLDVIKKHNGKVAKELMLEHLERGIIDISFDNEEKIVSLNKLE
ncbi:MAG: FadR/GntR family transcriptional regulator [Velocimicrobium sp.]